MKKNFANCCEGMSSDKTGDKKGDKASGIPMEGLFGMMEKCMGEKAATAACCSEFMGAEADKKPGDTESTEK